MDASSKEGERGEEQAASGRSIERIWPPPGQYKEKPPPKLPKPWRDVATLISLLVLFVALLLTRDLSPKEVLPLFTRQLTFLPQFGGAYRDEMLWGTYRPGLYLGLRTREAHGLQAGLMWFNPDAPDAIQAIRHQAEDRDGLSKFGWERHDGRSFGRQEIMDGDRHITTSFAKLFCKDCRGGDWGLRVNIQDSSRLTGTEKEGSTEGSVSEKTASIIFYIADDTGPVSVLARDVGKQQTDLAEGSTYPFGGWQLTAKSSQGAALQRLNYLGVQSAYVHNLTETVKLSMQQRSAGQSAAFGSYAAQTKLPNVVDPETNVALFQYTGPLPMSVDFTFTASLTKQPGIGIRRWLAQKMRGTFRRPQPGTPLWPTHILPKETLQARIEAVSGTKLKQLLHDREHAFDKEFEAKFGDLNSPKNPPGTAEVAKAALSNMLGSIGFFYGTSDIEVNGKIVKSKEKPLLASVPSRSFFPRGFLWDEGFHLLLVRKWDSKLSRDILAHWLDLLNSEGWIAREQILGEEARSRVPAEYITQNPKQANPPTLFLPLQKMGNDLIGKMEFGHFIAGVNVSSDLKDDAAFLKAAYPRLKKWLGWFEKSQEGKLDGSWRWRGRKVEFATNPFTGEVSEFAKELNPKTLTSGFDDYPRASHPSEEERHVDLYCWMAMSAKAAASIGRSLRINFAKIAPAAALSRELHNFTFLNELHWDPKALQYRDWGLHTEHVSLEPWIIDLPEQMQGYQIPESMRRRSAGLVRKVKGNPELQFIPHYGYVSLFPFIMQMLPADSPQLHAQLDHLKNGGISTQHGLRSLSTTSSIHGKYNTEHDGPYWRGPVWININYLVLRSLRHYAQAGGPYSAQAEDLYQELRASVMNLTVRGYQESGFLWENYNEESGQGGGCRPFTGWSALMVLIAAELY